MRIREVTSLFELNVSLDQDDFPSYRTPGDSKSSGATPDIFADADCLGGDDEIRIQHDANFAAEQIKQNGYAVAVGKPIE